MAWAQRSTRCPAPPATSWTAGASRPPRLRMEMGRMCTRAGRAGPVAAPKHTGRPRHLYQGGHGGRLPDPVYGGQLQDRAIVGVPAEGEFIILYQELRGSFADGEPYTLPLCQCRRRIERKRRW